MNYRIVADTNVIISSVLTPGGKPDQIFDAVFDGKLQLVLSNAILKETRRVFLYGKIQKELNKRNITPDLIEDFLVKLIKISIFVAPINNPATIKEDPADNAILAAAIDGNADFIVSGDQHLLALREYQGTKILAPADFIEEIKK